MGELKFVAKCLIFASLVMVFSQFEIENETLETKAEVFLQHSETASIIRDTARGGAVFIQKSIKSTQDFFQKKMARAGGSNEPLD